MLVASLAIAFGLFVEPDLTEPPAREFALAADDWARPRTGERVAAMPAVRAAMLAWMEAPSGTRMVVRHPGGERGMLWATELRDWLVSLGLPISVIELRPGGTSDEALLLRLEVAP